MKKTIFILMSILIVTSLILSACAKTETADPAVNEQGYPMDQAPAEQADQGYPAPEVVRIATDATFPPFEMQPKN